MSDPLFSVDSYDVAPDGNCFEATFRLPPKGLSFTIAPRDVVTIETRPDSSSSWVARYRGYVALAGNPRSDNVETYRLVGLKQRLFEVVLYTGAQSAIITSDDVADMANAAFDAALAGLAFPGIVGVDINSFDAPSLSFTAGDRITQLETVGSALDALAGSVGRFVVPTGDTYTYDGVTYSGGDIVPPVTWGVNASGETFFRRPIANIANISEDDINVDVTYPALSAEEVVDTPVLVYYPGMDLSEATRFQLRNLATDEVTPLAAVFQPWVYNVASADSKMRVVQLPNPEAYLLDATTEYAVLTDTLFEGFKAYDGNPATFATGTDGELLQFRRLTPNLAVAAVALRIDAEFGDDIGVEFRSQYSYTQGGQSRLYEFTWRPTATEEIGAVTRLRVTFPILLPVQLQSLLLDNSITLNLDRHNINIVPGPNGNGGTAKIYDFRVFLHVLSGNTTLADQLLQSYRVPLINEVSTVKIFGEEPIRTGIVLSPLIGSSFDVPVERVQYSITTAEGVTTTYHAGQAFDGELVSERVVLEGLARRAVRS
jgi:hypothetical protein